MRCILFYLLQDDAWFSSHYLWRFFLVWMPYFYVLFTDKIKLEIQWQWKLLKETNEKREQLIRIGGSTIHEAEMEGFMN